MKKTFVDYSRMTELAKKLGMVPYTNRAGVVIDGCYTMKDLEAPVDLSASAEDELSILKNAIKQLSEKADEAYHQSIERDLND